MTEEEKHVQCLEEENQSLKENLRLERQANAVFEKTIDSLQEQLKAIKLLLT
jgi:hypothetical protein